MIESFEEAIRLVLGSGLITGTSDNDPSGIGTYAVAGAALIRYGRPGPPGTV